MKIGDEVFVHGYVDEIRNDVVIIKNEGGYFGTVKEEVVDLIRCKDCEFLTNTMKCSAHYDDWGDLLDTSLDDYCSEGESKWAK